MPQPEQLYGLTWLGQQWNEERTDRQTGTFTERLRSNGPCAMMERHQQPGNSVHLLYTTERGGRFIVYSWMRRKNARCWWIMGSSTEASENHWGQPVCNSAGVSARRGLCEAKRPLRAIAWGFESEALVIVVTGKCWIWQKCKAYSKESCIYGVEQDQERLTY